MSSPLNMTLPRLGRTRPEMPFKSVD